MQALHHHVKTLVHQYNVTLCGIASAGPAYAQRYGPKRRANEGYVGKVALHDWPIRTDIGYCTALHELGHLLSPTQRRPQASDAVAVQLGDRRLLSDAYLLNELDAWHWARGHALHWTKTMGKEEHRCLRTYAGRVRWDALGVAISFTGTLKLNAWHARQQGG